MAAHPGRSQSAFPKRLTPGELFAECSGTEQRLLWLTWKQWPDSRPWRTDDDLAEDEYAWVLMQHQIDSGLRFCGACEAFGWHEHCGKCGRRFDGAHLRECSGCQSRVSTTFCVFCGTRVVTPFLLRFEAGQVDWFKEAEHANVIFRRIVERRRDLAPDLIENFKPSADDLASIVARARKAVS